MYNSLFECYQGIPWKVYLMYSIKVPILIQGVPQNKLREHDSKEEEKKNKRCCRVARQRLTLHSWGFSCPNSVIDHVLKSSWYESNLLLPGTSRRTTNTDPRRPAPTTRPTARLLVPTHTTPTPVPTRPTPTALTDTDGTARSWWNVEHHQTQWHESRDDQEATTASN